MAKPFETFFFQYISLGYITTKGMTVSSNFGLISMRKSAQKVGEQNLFKLKLLGLAEKVRMIKKLNFFVGEIVRYF